MPHKDPIKLREYKRNYNRVYYHTKRYFHSAKAKYSSLKSRSAKRGWVFDLTLAEYEKYVLGGICYYCQDSLPEVGCGLDRANHRYGYLRGNVVACCQWCNNKKGLLEAAGFVSGEAIVLLQRLVKSRKQGLLK